MYRKHTMQNTTRTTQQSSTCFTTKQTNLHKWCLKVIACRDKYAMIVMHYSDVAMVLDEIELKDSPDDHFCTCRDEKSNLLKTKATRSTKA